MLNRDVVERQESVAILFVMVESVSAPDDHTVVFKLKCFLLS
jgi:hypothetical protein